MIVEFCDICGKKLDSEHRDQVNLNFNSYGCVGFQLVLNKKRYKNELQLCRECADSVVSQIEDLQKIAEMDRMKMIATAEGGKLVTENEKSDQQ